MAPIHLIPLLEIYCSPLLKDRLHAEQNPAALDDLDVWGYIHYAEGEDGPENAVQLTDKGMCFVEAIMSVPEPTPTWAILKENM